MTKRMCGDDPGHSSDLKHLWSDQLQVIGGMLMFQIPSQRQLSELFPLSVRVDSDDLAQRVINQYLQQNYELLVSILDMRNLRMRGEVVYMMVRK